MQRFILVSRKSLTSLVSSTLLLWGSSTVFCLDQGLTQIPTFSDSNQLQNPPEPSFIPVVEPGVEPVVVPNSPNNSPEEVDPLAAPTSYSVGPLTNEPSSQFNRYRLDVGDGITVTVPIFPEFNTADAIDAEGNLLIPFLGRTSLKGLTLEEAETKIRYELGRRFLQKEPEVIAVLASPRPLELTVLGEVVRPGFYSLGTGAPLSAVLIAAGGSKSTADLRSIKVRRSLVDGSIIEEEFDLYTPLQTGTKLPNVRLQGGDTVIISRLEVGTDQDYDRRLIARTTLVQPTITIRVLSYAAGGVGTVAVPNGSTFLDVIGSVAPSPDSAALGDINLLRFDPEKGGIVTQEIDAKRAIKGDISQNLPLQDEDIIVVGRSLIGKLNFILQNLTQPIQTFSSFRNFFQGLPNLININQTGGGTSGN